MAIRVRVLTCSPRRCYGPDGPRDVFDCTGEILDAPTDVAPFVAWGEYSIPDARDVFARVLVASTIGGTAPIAEVLP